jgi:hypothetical protein
MAKGERAFWSSLPGILTGLAGILTAAVALLGLALSQGWIGDGGGEAANDSANGGEVVRISVEPEPLEFTKVPGQEAVKTVTVTNEGTGPIMVTTEITGENEGSFSSDDKDCTRSEIAPEGTCTVAVTFDASASVRSYQASLVVSAEGDDDVQEVELSGRSGDLLD